MRTQKPISLRIDESVLSQLDEFCANHDLRRNYVINAAIACYLGYPYK